MEANMDKPEFRAAAQQAAGRMKNFVSKKIDERSTVFGEQISGTARDLRSIGEQREANGPAGEGAASLAVIGADYIDGIGGYLKDALTLGFAASHMLESSSVQRFRAGSNG